jgi:predicted RecA/RadA family phage recombinase
MPKGTYIQKGETIDYTNGGASAIGYGDVIPLVTRIGMAGEDIAVGATGSVKTTGIYELPAVNNAAFAVGDQLYWDAAAGNLTNVSAGNTPAGWATEPKALAGTTARVKIG